MNEKGLTHKAKDDNDDDHPGPGLNTASDWWFSSGVKRHQLPETKKSRQETQPYPELTW